MREAHGLAARDAAPSGLRDTWTDVRDELRRRPLARAACWFLFLLHGLAIFAPLLANDRPYVLEAIDRQGYERARRSVTAVAGGLARLAEEGADAYAARTAGRSEAPAFDEALDLEVAALGERLGRMRWALDEARHAPLDALGERAVELAAAARVGRVTAERRAEAEALRADARGVREDFVIRAAGTDVGTGVELRGRRSHPLLSALGALEVALMGLWLSLLAHPVWARLVALLSRRASGVRTRRFLLAGVHLFVALSCVTVWGATFRGDGSDASSFVLGAAPDFGAVKAGLTDGSIEPTVAVFPPFAFGFAETHLDESFRPPTWTAASEIDDQGRYVRGPRVPTPDPVTGLTPGSTPVVVRFAEPVRNAGWRHPFGTDEVGRDLLVRMLHGARVSLAVGLLATLLLASIGVLVGVAAGYLGGRVDFLVSRTIEVVESIPAFFLVLTAVALVPAQSLHPLFAIVLFIGLVRWTGIARLVRGEYLTLREREFVAAARATGLPGWRIAFRHVLPNALGPVLVAISFSVAAGILTESAISFLGFGSREPTPSWGALLAASRDLDHWWIQVFPGLAIFATVLSFNLVGEGVRDALDPRTALARTGVGPARAAARATSGRS